MRRVAWTLVALAVAVAVGGLGHAAGCFRSPTNVLIIVMDTTRADRCSFLGYGRPTTPRLEALARESIVFEDAWSSAPWTCPAHAELFTGRPAWDLDVGGRELRPLGPSVATIAGALASAGRATGCFTANAWVSPDVGLTTGFETYVLTRVWTAAGSARETHDRAFAWMRERRGAETPFFAFINDMEPHMPYRPSLEARARVVPPETPMAVIGDARGIEGARSLRISVGAETLGPGVLEAASSLYDAEIADLDGEIGRLIDSMRSEGMLDDTLLVIVADHGEGLGDHGWMDHGVQLDREILRVPLLVRLPGGERGGTRVRDVVRLADVLPTVLEVCGVATPVAVRGRSLLSDTAGRIATAKHRASREFQRMAESVVGAAAADVVSRVWKSAYDGRYHLVSEETMPLRLFDVASDPGERHDVAAEHPDVVARLAALLPD